MKTKTLALTFILAFLLSSVAGLILTETATANPGFLNSCPDIVIASDGFISPDTQGIQRNANTYFLTQDINGYSLIIQCSNIILDGRGYLLNCTPYTNHPIHLELVTNVTVIDLEIQGTRSIAISSSNCTIKYVRLNNYISLMGDLNTVTKCTAGIDLNGENNIIAQNNITGLAVWGSHTTANAFYKNNFLCNEWYLYANATWDNGLVGNYWVGYNGTDANHDGIGDTPYILNEKNAASYMPRLETNNIDYYPLIHPYVIENDKLAPSPADSEQQNFLIVLAAGVSALSIAAVITGLIYYHKKRRTEKIDGYF